MLSEFFGVKVLSEENIFNKQIDILKMKIKSK